MEVAEIRIGDDADDRLIGFFGEVPPRPGEPHDVRLSMGVALTLIDPPS